MKKKIFAIGLATAMTVSAVGLMAGCGGRGADGAADGSSIMTAVAREPSSGTREVFEEKVVKDGVSIADWLDEGNTMPGEISEQSSTAAVITQVSQSFDRLGYVSLGSYMENTDKVQAVTVDGVEATKENVQSGEYSIWRNFNIIYQPGALESNDLLANFVLFMESEEGQEIMMKDYIQLPGLEVKEYTPYAGTTKTTLNCSGSTSVAPLMRELAAAFSKANDGKVTVNVQEGGSGVGMQQATEGTVDFGMSYRELKAEEDAAVDAMHICLDGVAVIVKKGSKCTAVTLAQLFDLYTALTPIVTEA